MSLSLITLILANFFPLLGILFWNYNIGEIIFIYWVETVVIGVINVFKMILAQGQSTWQGYRDQESFRVIPKARIIVFFMFHFGLFSLIHGIFIRFITSSYLKSASFKMLLLIFASLAISHIFSFFYNYIFRKEYLNASLDKLFVQPYIRIWITHITIIFGFILVVVYKSEILLPSLLIFLKTCADGFQHVFERRKYQKI